MITAMAYKRDTNQLYICGRYEGKGSYITAILDGDTLEKVKTCDSNNGVYGYSEFLSFSKDGKTAISVYSNNIYRYEWNEDLQDFDNKRSVFTNRDNVSSSDMLDISIGGSETIHSILAHNDNLSEIMVIITEDDMDAGTKTIYLEIWGWDESLKSYSNRLYRNELNNDEIALYFIEGCFHTHTLGDSFFHKYTPSGATITIDDIEIEGLKYNATLMGFFGGRYYFSNYKMSDGVDVLEKQNGKIVKVYNYKDSNFPAVNQKSKNDIIDFESKKMFISKYNKLYSFRVEEDKS